VKIIGTLYKVLACTGHYSVIALVTRSMSNVLFFKIIFLRDFLINIIYQIINRSVPREKKKLTNKSIKKYRQKKSNNKIIRSKNCNGIIKCFIRQINRTTRFLFMFLSFRSHASKQNRYFSFILNLYKILFKVKQILNRHKKRFSFAFSCV
jgi:hypothetical protein